MEDFNNLTHSLSFLSDKKVEAEEYSEDKMWGYVEASQVSFDCPINKPPAIMSIVECDKTIPICTKGNFSLWKGKAKSRKTFGLSMLATALAYNKTVYKTFKPDMKDKITLFIDTEQSEYHVYRFVNSVVNISGFTNQANEFRAVSLRKYDTAFRLKLVEFMIYNVNNLGFVIIDGVRDLIKDINSIDEAVMITDKLLKWTKEKDIHIAVLIHENPTGEGNKARGHIGTELTNKAETIIRFEKNKEDKRQTIIFADDTRGEEFEPIYFEIDHNDMGLYPVIVEKSSFEIQSRF